MKKIKIAYIGGGSKMWAMTIMNDLAFNDKVYGDIYLYDIDNDASLRNEIIGNKIKEIDGTAQFSYHSTSLIEEALTDADFVILSILPGTFSEMEVDVHEPERYGVNQTVGDTVGPGGVIRSMRVVPIYEYFARMIKEYAKDAWVINFTNPMSICVKTLYDNFKEIKCFGCCHEVFHAIEFLSMVVKEHLNLDTRPKREEIKIDVEGINHFTWITSAKYQDMEVLPWVKEFKEKHFDEGIYEGDDPLRFKYDSFAYGNKVKMDLFERYGALAAAGDRHLVEFVDNNWYLKNKEMMKEWAISQTPVSYRVDDMHKKIDHLNKLRTGEENIVLKKSNEEAVEIMLALLGFKDLVTNVNYPNYGQVKDLPKNDIVESNCIFKKDKIDLIVSKELPLAASNLVLRNSLNIDTCYEGIKKRDLDIIFASFINQPLLSNLTIEEAKELFKSMVLKTRKYLDEYYEIDKYFNKE